jgi:Flp pilus assembly protein TadG
MRERIGTTKRRGALMVEAAFVHPIMLILIFMIIIGGMGVFRYQQVACQAREAARWTAVRGSDWRHQTGKPFPTTNDILNKAVLPYAAGMNPKSLSLQVEWIDEVNGKGKAEDWDSAAKHPKSVDNDNRSVSNRVRVTVTYQWSPEFFIVGAIKLRSTSEIAMSY